MKSHSKHALLALAIIVPVVIVGVLVWQGQQQDAVTPDYMIEETEDTGVVLAAPAAEEPAIEPVATTEETDENPLKPIGPRASDRLPAACGSCGA